MSDYIKREDAMELINKCVSHTSPKAKIMDFRHGEINGLNWACDIIEAMPPADVAPVRHGRWIESGTWVDMYTTDEDPMFECSECGDVIIGGGIPFVYCPNCGAKMDEEIK